MTPWVEVRRLEVAYDGQVAVRGVDLDIPRDGVTALLGPSGCGKTSLLRAIAGFERPVAGSVHLGGEPVVAAGCWVPPEKRRVAMMFQEGALFPHLTVEGNVRYGLERGPAAAERAREVLELVGMADLRERFPDELSSGQQQRVALARALAPGPRLVLLDEPFANLDAALRAQVREEVRSILQAAGATAVLVTHDQEEALSMADLVVVMEGGRILQTGAPQAVYDHPASPVVARFLGDGQLLPCEVRAGRARSLFGEVGTDAPDGPGLLLVRPEDLAARAGPVEAGAAGTVERRRFFGHDLIDEIRLADSGELVRVRCLTVPGYGPGSRVALTLRDRTFRVFPPAADE
ncbi:MAG: ABC transporter ATP-binding protein [Acidobacteriota bacterium]